jgi:hypothetical protein
MPRADYDGRRPEIFAGPELNLGLRVCEDWPNSKITILKGKV